MAKKAASTTQPKSWWGSVEGSNPRQTGFPEAHRPTRYGKFYESFYTRMDQGKNVSECWPSFKGLLNITLAKARLDESDPFWNEYQAHSTKSDGSAKKRSELSLDDLDAVVLACESFWERMGLWDWEKTPEDTI